MQPRPMVNELTVYKLSLFINLLKQPLNKQKIALASTKILVNFTAENKAQATR